MRSRFCSPVVLALAAHALLAHDPVTTALTWDKEISRIVYKRCASCHRLSGQAMPLETYEQARPWAKAIRDEVADRRMPPWGPVPGVGRFKADRSLSVPEIQMLIQWVEGGAPEGDPALRPARIPLAEQPPVMHYTRALALSSSRVLTSPATLVAIKPSGPLDAWAEEPDGTVTRLIWILQPSRWYTSPFIFESPLTFPSGTMLHSKGRGTLFLQDTNLRR